MPNVTVITEDVYRKRSYLDEIDRRFISADEMKEILDNPEKYDGQEFILRSER